MTDKMKRQFAVNIVEIKEISPEGWLLQWNTGDEEWHATAAEALQVIISRDIIMANAGISCVTTVNWTTCTPIGKAVVKALQ